MNGSVSPVIVAEEGTPYTAPEQSTTAFASLFSGNVSEIVIGDFYLADASATANDQDQLVLLDLYVPVYANRAVPEMIINLQLDSARVRGRATV